MAVIDPTPEQIKALAESGHAGPVQMINLLQFKPDGGIESYERYAAEVQPHLDAVGARLIALSATRQTVVGEDERPWWDAIITVEYPSVQAFLQMAFNEAYQAIVHHRTNALERAALIATTPGTLRSADRSDR